MQTIEIRPQERALVEAILKEFLPPEAKIWVFGSRINGKARRGSDLDLAIELGRPLNHQEALNLAEAFEESDLPYKVDIVDLQSVAGYFKAIIERDRIVWE